MLDLKDLNLFAKVVTLENFSAAGRALGMSPAVVSKRIGNLEERLGVRLLNRTTRQVSLTDDGLSFYHHALRILDQVQEAEGSLGVNKDKLTGRLKVTAPATFGRMHLTPWVMDFLDIHPDLSIDLVFTDSIVDIVAEGIDVAIRIGPMPDSSLMARRLARNRRVVCASPNYIEQFGAPETPEGLSDHNCLVMPNQHIWKIGGSSGEKDIRPKGNLTANDIAPIHQACIAGLGIARFSTWHVAEDLYEGRLVSLLKEFDIDGDFSIRAVFPSSRFIAPRVRAFVDFLVERCSGDPPYWDQKLGTLKPENMTREP